MDVVQFDEALISGKPKQLVFLTGLDLANNSRHNITHQLFANFTDDRFPVHFKILNGDVDLCPPKKDSFAIKGPRGVLKRTWVRKYTEQKPAVIAIFTDLDWNHPSWNEKKTECESKLNSLRQSVGEGSATRFALVLLQSRLPSEDGMASERTAELCAQCRISPKQLFTLCLPPNTDPNRTSVVRLVQAFHEMCQTFYQHTIRAVRARAIPNNYANLLIRQQFKLAFLSELRMDTHTALRHYRQAYNQLVTYEVLDCDAYEIRTVAGLLNYKICQLSFAHSAALEAISQYQKFKAFFYTDPNWQYPSPQLASIELSLWKAQQSVWFAELLKSAIAKTLVGVSTQHPGLHYHAAANFYIEANLKIANLKMSIIPNMAYPQPDPLFVGSVHTSVDPLRKTNLYYGQRPWRTAFENGDLADPITERNGRVALELNCAPNHPRVMNLLQQALTNYRFYRCSRYQRQVMVQMADEYILTKEPANAANLLTRVMWELRRSNLLNLLHPVLLRMLSASYCTGALKDYMMALVQLMNPKLYQNAAMLPQSTLPEAYASFFAQNFVEICDGRSIPQPIQSLSAMLTDDELSHYEQDWKKRLDEPSSFTIPMNGLDSFVSVRASFLSYSREVPAETKVVFQVSLRNRTATAFRFSRFHVAVDKLDSGQDSEGSTFLWEFEEPTFDLESRKVVTKRFSFVPKPSEIGCDLIIRSISLQMGGSESKRSGKLDWEAPFPRIGASHLPNTLGLGHDIIRIVTPNALATLELENKCPKSLLGEISDLKVELRNEEGFTIENLRIECSENIQDNLVSGRSLRFLAPENTFVPVLIKELSTVDDEQTVKIPIHYCCYATGNRQVCVKASYTVQGAERVKSAVFDVVSEQPFLLRPSILTVNSEPVTWIVNGEDSVLRAEVEATAPLTIRSIRWSLNNELTPLVECEEKFDDESGSMQAGEVWSPCVIVKANTPLSSTICDLGQLVITWDRPQSTAGIGASVRSVLDLGSAPVEQVPIVVTSHVSESPCVVRSPIPIVFTLKNTSTEVLDLRLTLDLSDVFMFAGHKEISVRLLPGDSYDSRVTLLALSAGRLPFPRLVIECPQLPIDKKSFGSVPLSLFVLPHVKN